MNFLLLHVLVILYLREEVGAIISDKEFDNQEEIHEAEKVLRSEIESFEKLQSKIVAIEENLRKAADSSDIDEQKLMEINSLLLDIDKKVVKPLTDKLMNYQTNLGDPAMRNSETLQLIENFVSKAENVLQTKVSQINSLQNKVDSLNVGVVKEVPAAIDIKETNGNNYATFKSSKIIRDHIESHKKKNANSSDQKSRSNETTKRKLKIFRTIIEPYVLPAIPVLVILLLLISFFIYRCIKIRRDRKEAASTTTSTVASNSSSRSPTVSQVLASDLGYTELKSFKPPK